MTCAMTIYGNKCNYIDCCAVVVPIISYIVTIISFLLSMKAYRLVQHLLVKCLVDLYTEITVSVYGKVMTILYHAKSRRNHQMFW